MSEFLAGVIGSAGETKKVACRVIANVKAGYRNRNEMRMGLFGVRQAKE